jgi:NAD(P) transhydrogenase subunit alpha
MTGAVLVAIYIVALSFFLGLDIISKVPPTLYALVLAGLGAVAAVSLVGALAFLASGYAAGPSGALGRVALGAAAAAAVGGTVALGRMAAAFTKRKRAAGGSHGSP